MTARNGTHRDGENVTDAPLIQPEFAGEALVEPNLFDGTIEVTRDEHSVRLGVESRQVRSVLYLTTEDARVLSKQLKEVARDLERHGTPD